MQDISVQGEPLYLEVARKALDMHKNMGLVVAGNDPEALRKVRQVTQDAWFLSPGIGVQGGDANQAFAYGARSDGKGILVVVARAIADSENPSRTALELRDQMRSARDSRIKINSVSARGKENSTYQSLKRDFVHSLLSTGCFRLGNFVLKSGIMSPFYIDLRKLVADPDSMRIAGKAYAYLATQCSNYDCIAGIPSAGLPLATVASLETGKPMIWPRMPLKEHGTGNKVEGIFSKNDRALLLDDLITTGASKIEAIEILRSEGLIVDDLIVLIERGEEGRVDMQAAGVQLHAFIHVKELFDILEQIGNISERQHKELVKFIENS
jgi:uridine monophosphate synthetase